MWSAQPSILTKVTIMLDDYLIVNPGVKDLPWLGIEPQSPSQMPQQPQFLWNFFLLFACTIELAISSFLVGWIENSWVVFPKNISCWALISSTADYPLKIKGMPFYNKFHQRKSHFMPQDKQHNVTQFRSIISESYCFERDGN